MTLRFMIKFLFENDQRIKSVKCLRKKALSYMWCVARFGTIRTIQKT